MRCCWERQTGRKDGDEDRGDSRPLLLNNTGTKQEQKKEEFTREIVQMHKELCLVQGTAEYFDDSFGIERD